MNQPKFEIGDRVTYASPELPYQKNRGIGEVVWEMATHYYIRWQDSDMECPHLKESEYSLDLLVKVSELSKIDILPEISKPKRQRKPKPSLPEGIKVGDLENPNKIDSFPETTAADLHGYFEHYQPVIKGAKSYWYRRYVYTSISGKLVHHHVPNKMVESIEALWRSGATAKEICVAIGKKYLGKDSA